MPVNRVVAVATAVLGLVVAVAPTLANVDWSSAATIIAGAAVVAGAALKWLDGWQKYEARVTAPYTASSGNVFSNNVVGTGWPEGQPPYGEYDGGSDEDLDFVEANPVPVHRDLAD